MPSKKKGFSNNTTVSKNDSYKLNKPSSRYPKPSPPTPPQETPEDRSLSKQEVYQKLLEFIAEGRLTDSRILRPEEWEMGEVTLFIEQNIGLALPAIMEILRDKKLSFKARNSIAHHIPANKLFATAFLNQLGDEPDPEIRLLLATGLLSNGFLLLENEETRDTYLSLLGGDKDPKVRDLLVDGLFAKADLAIVSNFLQARLIQESDFMVKHSIITCLASSNNDSGIQFLLSMIRDTNVEPDLRATAISWLFLNRKPDPNTSPQYYSEIVSTLWEVMEIVEQENIPRPQMQLLVSAMNVLAASRDGSFLNWLFETIDSYPKAKNKDIRFHAITFLRYYPDNGAVINKLWEIIRNEQETEDLRYQAISNLARISIDYTDSTKQGLNLLLTQTSSPKIKTAIFQAFEHLEKPLEFRRRLCQ